MSEEFLMILEGGPFPGNYAVSELTWPLPELVPAKGYTTGAYTKVFQSKGPAQKDGELIKLRGAKYAWDEKAEPYALEQ